MGYNEVCELFIYKFTFNKSTNMGKTKYLGQIGSAVLTCSEKKHTARRQMLFSFSISFHSSKSNLAL